MEICINVNIERFVKSVAKNSVNHLDFLYAKPARSVGKRVFFFHKWCDHWMTNRKRQKSLSELLPTSTMSLSGYVTVVRSSHFDHSVTIQLTKARRFSRNISVRFILRSIQILWNYFLVVKKVTGNI